jgi:hypothetical protein
MFFLSGGKSTRLMESHAYSSYVHVGESLHHDLPVDLHYFRLVHRIWEADVFNVAGSLRRVHRLVCHTKRILVIGFFSQLQMKICLIRSNSHVHWPRQDHLTSGRKLRYIYKKFSALFQTILVVKYRKSVIGLYHVTNYHHNALELLHILRLRNGCKSEIN